MDPRSRFLAAIRGQQTDRPAIGSVTSIATIEAMERSGAAFPQAHLDGAVMAELAAFASLETGMEAIAPVFSVVHEAAALGAEVDWGTRDRMPAVTERYWHQPEDIDISDDFEERPSLRIVCEALGLLKAQYGDTHALVGKVFGPLSLSFHLFGVEAILMMTIEDPEALRVIFTRLAEVTVRSALAQIAAGADLLCVGDHCSRDMFSPDTYRELLFPLHQELARRIPCPLVLHACGDTSDRISFFAQAGLSCFHYDTVVPAQQARALAGPGMALMGGVSNIHSLLPGDINCIRMNVAEALAAGINVIGPECAIPLTTSLASLKTIREAIEKG